jgi:hypothetical protein
MESIERWWNGARGRLVRRDVWLRTDGNGWEVELLIGGVEGESRTWEFCDETEARAQMSRLIAESGGWRQLSVGAWGRRDRKNGDSANGGRSGSGHGG